MVSTFLWQSCRSPLQWKIRNPYEHIDWQAHKQYKANFHTHTTLSDGLSTPQEAIDLYSVYGYSILSLTDHDHVSWPWQSFGRDPEMIGMIAIQGNEVSSFHHFGSYFNDYQAREESENEAIAKIGKRGGLAVLFHPGRYNKPVGWYLNMFRRHPHLIGLEVYNQGDRYPRDRELWDTILTNNTFDRAVWAFSNDDMHDPEIQFGRNWNVMLLPDLSEESVYLAMKQGMFFFVYSPSGHVNNTVPSIDGIEVDSCKGFIRIEARDYEYVEWISDGQVVDGGSQIELSLLHRRSKYVRAIVYGRGGAVTGTQPFYIRTLPKRKSFVF